MVSIALVWFSHTVHMPCWDPSMPSILVAPGNVGDGVLVASKPRDDIAVYDIKQVMTEVVVTDPSRVVPMLWLPNNADEACIRQVVHALHGFVEQLFPGGFGQYVDDTHQQHHAAFDAKTKALKAACDEPWP
jgi:hypothetical protein